MYLLKIVIELMNCLFCKIANKEIPSEIIYEDGDTVGALDIQPRAPGHAMIIPKHHCENILDIPNEKIGAVFSAVRKITELLKEKLRPDGFTIGINHGRVSGQTIDHLHIHVIPRWASDGGGSVHSAVNNPPEISVGEMAEKIRRGQKHKSL